MELCSESMVAQRTTRTLYAGGDALYAGSCGGGLYLLVVSEVLKVSEVIRCVLLYSLEAVEGGFCLLEVPEPSEVMCCVRERIGTGYRAGAGWMAGRS